LTNNPKRTNRLARCKSPYLLQHAHNPVHWYSWCPEAFQRAAALDRPIFLSIGYSTCHWCHVMEKESFSDPEVAELMNNAFINIKVDREEHPHIDHIYMAVCQQVTGTGGWPLTIIMTPDRRPFFAGTYFPRESIDGRMSMLELIPKVKSVWDEKKVQAIGTANEIVRKVSLALTPSPGMTPAREFLDHTFSEISDQFDETHGGFGTSPKFPSPMYLSFLMRYWRRKENELALEMILSTLQSMKRGGIYDQVGFGFHRYATDEKWKIPHFEKMLSDQALMSMAYTDAYLITADEEYSKIAQQTLEYVLRDLMSPEGAFYTAQDADSEGVEGKFYTWTIEELEAALNADKVYLFTKVFDLTPEGNLLSSDGRPTGRNVLAQRASLEDLSREAGVEEIELKAIIDQIKEKLLQERELRVRPFRDEKILTDWNGLMITALARAASAFDDYRYAEAAEKCADFIFNNMKGGSEELLHSYYEGRVSVQGNLDDYAYLLWGLMELYQATFKVKHLKRAIGLAEEMQRLFWDDKNGGFFYSTKGNDPLPFRHKFASDSSFPSSNAVAAINLLKIGRLVANPKLEERVALLGRVFSQQFENAPHAFAHLASALDMALHSSAEVIIVGDPEAEDTIEMLCAIRRSYWPNTISAFVPTTEKNPEIGRLIPYTKGMKTFKDKATAYVCKDFICRAPTTSPDEMLATVADIEKMRI